MRVVGDAGELPRAFAGATAEAEASFKDGRVYMEKLVRSPRHIEVQVLGDEFRQHRALRRARLLGAEAGASEDHRRDAGAESRAERRGPRCTRWRCARAVTSATPTPERSSFCVGERRVVLHGDEHANSGRAPGYRDGVQHRSRQGADPHRGGRAARIRAARYRGARPRDRVPDQRRGSAQQLCAGGRAPSRRSSFPAARAFASTRTSTPARRFRRTTTR